MVNPSIFVNFVFLNRFDSFSGEQMVLEDFLKIGSFRILIFDCLILGQTICNSLFFGVELSLCEFFNRLISIIDLESFYSEKLKELFLVKMARVIKQQEIKDNNYFSGQHFNLFRNKT